MKLKLPAIKFRRHKPKRLFFHTAKHQAGWRRRAKIKRTRRLVFFGSLAVILFVAPIIYLTLLHPQSLKAAPWAQTAGSWTKRKQVTLTNNSGQTFEANTTYAININTQELVSAGYLNSDCSDLRIYYQPDENTTTKLAYYFDTAAGATNCSDSTSTKVYFPLQANLSNSSSTGAYYIYYGNTAAASEASVDAFDVGSTQALMVCPFNGDTECINGDGSEAPTTASGAIRYGGSKSALSFDGANSSLTLPSSGSLGGQTQWTVEFWTKSDRWDATGYPTEWMMSLGAGYLHRFFGLRWYLSFAGEGLNPTIYQTYPSPPTADQWTHFAIVYDGSQVRTYTDGTLVDSSNYTGTPYSAGSQIKFSTQGSNYWEMQLDELRVSTVARYSSNFTPQTAPFVRDDHTKLLYHFDENGDDPRNSGKAIDDSGNGNHGTITGAKYVAGLVGVDASTSDTGNVPAQAYAGHSGVFIEEGTTNLVTNPSFENGTYSTNWQSGGNSFSTFTPGIAKRNSAGPFAAGVSFQGKWDASSSSQDVVTFPRGTQISSNFYSQLDPYQGSVVFWITPEWNGNDNKYHSIINGSYNFLLNKATNNTLTFSYRRLSDDTWHSVTASVSSWVAGQTHQVVVSWDSNNAIQGSNFVRLSIDDTHTYGGDQPKVYLPYSDIRVGSDSNSNFSADAIIEGLTIYRRPLFDGTYGVDVGNGDEIWKMNSGGTHTGSNNASVMTDSELGWGSSAFAGGTIVNQTDGSSGTITATGNNTVTATLSGGTDNDWDTGDVYIITGAGGKDPTLITGSWDVVFALPTNASTGSIVAGTGEAWSHPHASNLLYTSSTNTGGFMMNGTYTSDGWADEGTPSSVAALSASEKIYSGGYKVTSDAANEGIYYAKTVAAGDDWVIRALGNSDGTCAPRVVLYDQTNGAEIGHLDGTTTSTRTAPDTYVFTGEAPTGMTSLRVKLINTASSGTCYWHQVELLSNRIDNSSFNRGSGSPWCASGWSCGSYNQSDQSTDSHSGTYSAHFVQSSVPYSWLIWSGFSYTKTINKFYSAGHFSKSASNAPVFEIDSYPTYIPLPKVSTNASWTHKSEVFRQSVSGGTIRMGGTGYASSYYFDDFYLVEQSDVSLTVTPATSTNSVESGQIRVDGKDKYSQTLPSPTTTTGTITFDYTPRHNAADVAKFGEATPAIAYVTDLAASSGIHSGSSNASALTDSTKAWTTNQWVGFSIRNLTDGSVATVTANTATTVTATLSGGTDNDWDTNDKYYIESDDYIKLYWSAANTVKLEYSMAGTTGNGTWDATSAIAAGTKYDFEIAYTGSGTMTLKVDDVTKITLSSIPAAFGTAPTLAFWGSDSSGAQQGDATFLPQPVVPSENSTAPYFKFGSKSAKLTNTLSADGRGYITQIDPNSTAYHTLSAYVYNGTSGAVGGTVSNTVAQLVWEGTAQSGTTYTDMGGGWWRLSYTAATTDATNDYGVQAAAGKTIYIDGLQLEQKAYASTYADGSLGTGYAWSGTANASTSSRTDSALEYATTSNIDNRWGTANLWVKKYNWNRTNQPGWSGGVLFSEDGGSDFYFGVHQGVGLHFRYSASGGYITYNSDALNTNQWQMLTIRWDGNGSVVQQYQMFVNGSQVATATGLSESLNTLSKVIIGASADGGISDVKVYGGALTDTQIADLYYSGLGSHQVQSDFTEQFAGVDENPVLNWKFDEATGTVAYDSSSNGNNGVIAGPTWSSDTFASAQDGKSLQFDGSNDYVSKTYSADVELDPSKQPFTASAWFKSPSSTGSLRTIIARYNGSGYKVYLNSSGYLCFGIDDDSTWGPDDSACSTRSFADSKWHLVTAIKEATAITVYVDGVKVATNASLTATGHLSGSDPTFYVGIDSDGTSNPWSGFIDEVRVYGYAQSTAQILADVSARGSVKGVSSAYTGEGAEGALGQGLVGYWKMDEASWNGTTGEVKDASGNGNNGTRVGDATTAAGKFSNGGTFDGTGDYASLGQRDSLALRDEKSFSAWVKTTDSSSSMPIVGKGGIGISGTSDKYVFGVYQGQVWGIHRALTGSTFSTNTVSDGQWHLITWVYSLSKNSNTVFIDGQVAGYGNVSQVVTSADSSDVELGRADVYGLEHFNGSVDELRVYNRALSPAEVQALYNYAPGPVAYWKMDDGSGTSVADSSGNGHTGTATAQTTIVTGKFGKARKSSSAAGQITYTAINTPAEYTAMAWAQFPLPTTTDGWRTLFSHNGGTYHPILVDVNGLLGIYNSAWSSSGFDVDSLSAGWHHIASTASGSTTLFYIDGKYVGTAAGKISTSDFSSLGNYTSSGGQWFGTFDEAKIYNYVRTPQQIVEDMNAGHPAPGSPVGSALVHLKMDEGYGETLHNSGSGGASYNADMGGSCPGASTCPSWTNNSKIDKGLSFDGAANPDGDYATLNLPGLIDTGTTSFSISAWLKKNSNTGNSVTLAKFGYHGGIFPISYSDGFFCNIANTSLQNFSVSYSSTLGEWNHYVCEFDVSSNMLRLFVDGSLVGETAFTGSVYDYSDVFYLGGNGGNFASSVNMDEVKIYTSALTDSQVKAEFNQGKATVLGALSTDASGVSSNSSDRSYCPPGDTTGTCAPVGEWKLDENTGTTTVYDTSGNGNNGTMNGSMTESDWVPGKEGSALDFDGTDDGVSLGEIFNSVTLPVTVEGWVFTRSLATNSHIFLSDGGTNYAGFNFFISPSGDVQILYGDNTGAGSTDRRSKIATAYITADNKWHHVVGVIRGATDMSLYVDGKDIGGSYSGTGGSMAHNVSQPAYFGRSGGSFSSNIIDEVRVYDYARTSEQIAWDYDHGKPAAWYKFDECDGGTLHSSNDVYDSSLNGTWYGSSSGSQTSVGNCTTSSTAWGNGATGKVNGSLNFDGTDDYISLGDLSILDNSTQASVSMWYKTSSNPTDQRILFDKDTSLRIQFKSNQLQVLTGSGGGWVLTEGEVAVATSELSTSTWHLITLTFDGQNTSLYVDGILRDTIADTSFTLGNNANPFTIGDYGASHGTYNYAGQIDEVKIYTYAQSQQQILTDYNAGAVRYAE